MSRSILTPDYVRTFVEAVYPLNTDLVLATGNERKCLEDATATIRELREQANNLKQRVFYLESVVEEQHHPDDHPINQVKPERDPIKEIEVGDMHIPVGGGIPATARWIRREGVRGWQSETDDIIYNDKLVEYTRRNRQIYLKRPDQPGDVFEDIETGEYFTDLIVPIDPNTRSRLRRVLYAREKEAKT